MAVSQNADIGSTHLQSSPCMGGSQSAVLAGSGDEDDIAFVVGILRAYDGSSSILDICKAIIKAVPERSGVWKEVAAAIETTGVVRGEYGMVQAYEQKLQAISDWRSDEDSRVQAFAEWLTDGLQGMIEHEQRRADEGLALRKYRFGIGKDES